MFLNREHIVTWYIVGDVNYTLILAELYPDCTVLWVAADCVQSLRKCGTAMTGQGGS